MSVALEEAKQLTKTDFVSGQTIRWCPGCGDYAILASVQRALPEIGVKREDIVFVAGIGCSSRFPYYMNTYGIHSIHGRAPAVATGLKLARPELSVWVVTGDGDALSIGGNHILHTLRRNLDLNILLFNNRIYGLTKGQYSPTSELGKVTKSTPKGSFDTPLEPLQIAFHAGASFIARSWDTAKDLPSILKASHAHRGTSFIEIYQNCNIFNDHAFEHLVHKNQRADNLLILEAGQPIVFGKEQELTICIYKAQPHVVKRADVEESEILVHDPHDSWVASVLTQLKNPDFPVPMGILYASERPCYEDQAGLQDEPMFSSKDIQQRQEIFQNILSGI